MELLAASVVRRSDMGYSHAMEPFRSKYQWRRTGTGSHDGFDGNVRFGRVIFEVGGGPRQWRWEGGLDPRIKMTIKPHVGAAERESDAVALVEAHYESCLRLNGLTKGRAIQFSSSDVQEGQ